MFLSSYADGLDHFIQSLVDASYGTISADEPKAWRPNVAELGPTSGVLVRFDLPRMEFRVSKAFLSLPPIPLICTIARQVRVSHATLYCVEHEPFGFFGTSMVAPVTIDWVNPSKSKHEPSWSNIFHGSNVGNPVANAFKVG